MRKNAAVVLFALLLGSGLLCFAADNSEKEKAATDAAQQWLATVDGGKYAESWDEAAAVFKAATSKENWSNTLKQVRAPLGNVKSRTVKSAQYTTTLPGAPEGEYVVIQFNTSFDGLSPATETIVPMKDPDGKWRVSGYFIKPAGK